MMMVRLTATRTATGGSYDRGGHDLAGTVGSVLTAYFPADRCSWEQTANSNGGYDITNARFFAGNDADGVALGSTTGVTAVVELGYIGKSGRFVPITA